LLRYNPNEDRIYSSIFSIQENAMPIHDWTRVDAGLFHDFHQGWIIALSNALHSGVLPSDFFALVEQRIHGPVSDIEAEIYAARANRLTIRHRHGDVVAVVEIVSPGNKASRSEFRAFVEKSIELIRHGIHLLVIDLFPPGPRDPQGIHKAIWDDFEEEEIELPSDKPLTLASYDAGPTHIAYVNFVAVGDALPDAPLFLQPQYYVPAPLESTYQAMWALFPAPLKPLLESPTPPASTGPGSA
jgi:hypothetical protein